MIFEIVSGAMWADGRWSQLVGRPLQTQVRDTVILRQYMDFGEGFELYDAVSYSGVTLNGMINIDKLGSHQLELGYHN
jgi:hypothetical protein